MSGYRTGAIVGATLAECQTAERATDCRLACVPCGGPERLRDARVGPQRALGTYGAALVVVTKTIQEALTYFVQHLRHLIVTELPKNANRTWEHTWEPELGPSWAGETAPQSPPAAPAPAAARAARAAEEPLRLPEGPVVDPEEATG
ncbi:hypothetical protein FJT64_025990 [Amphibalanus amphitrite]|uniref:Uncharacterized protein n=1 Tax=Amphibalanus amphitrite TaxID=1232801 RepID=A0A6A4WG61_AMPAM|nr:hypothetical protein FJT64_025990 [Amphibalanus amphitrite]